MPEPSPPIVCRRLVRVAVGPSSRTATHGWDGWNEQRIHGPQIPARVQTADRVDFSLCRGVAGAFTHILRSRIPGTHQDLPRYLCPAHVTGYRSGADLLRQVGPPADRSIARVGLAGARERRIRRRAAVDLLDCAHGLSLHR